MRPRCSKLAIERPGKPAWGSHSGLPAAYAPLRGDPADSLREKGERRLMTRIFASWNQLEQWLRQMEGFSAWREEKARRTRAVPACLLL